MSRLTKEEIRQSLLEHLKKKGLMPGRLLVAKRGASLNVVQGTIEYLEENIEELTSPIQMEMSIMGLDSGTILMFVNAHGIRRKVDNSWDFWYEFLIEEQTIFVPSSRFGDWKLKNEFEIK